MLHLFIFKCAAEECAANFNGVSDVHVQSVHRALLLMHVIVFLLLGDLFQPCKSPCPLSVCHLACPLAIARVAESQAGVRPVTGRPDSPGLPGRPARSDKLMLLNNLLKFHG